MKISKPIALAILFPAWFLAALWYVNFEFARNFGSAVLLFGLMPALSLAGYVIGDILK